MKKSPSAGRLRSRLSYANVIATLALFIALGGVSWAAVKLPKNSVTSKAIKKNAVTNAKIKRSAVTSAKIRNSTITNVDIKNGTISGAKLNLGSLGTVPSATTAGSAGTANDQFSVLRTAIPAPGFDDQNIARAQAPEILIASHGHVSVYAKCFVDSDSSIVYASVFARTGANGAVMEGPSPDDAYEGDPALNASTLEVDREVTAINQVPNGINNDFAYSTSLVGPDGKGLYFDAQVYVRSGASADPPGFLANSQSCAFHVAGSKSN